VGNVQEKHKLFFKGNASSKLMSLLQNRVFVKCYHILLINRAYQKFSKSISYSRLTVTLFCVVQCMFHDLRLYTKWSI